MQLGIIYKEPPQSSRQGSLFGAGNFSKDMAGVTGYVRKHSMKTMTVSVELKNGIMLHSVRVPSKTWIDETAPTVTGTVDLPPINTYVFVFLPYGMENLSGAVILFSMFDDRSEKQESRFVEGEENIVTDVVPGNMKTTYDRETGNFKLNDLDDENFVIEIDRENKKLHLKDWSENEVTVDQNGIILEDTNTNKITAGSSGIEMADKNGNKITMQSGKVLVNNHLEVLQ
jgi:hypothetical protein